MTKVLTYIFAALLLAVSCQKPETAGRDIALVSFYLENAPAGEAAPTKTAMPEVDVNDFKVYAVSGRDLFMGNSKSYSYLYRDIVANKNTIELEVGIYTVSAENVSEADALSKPTAWGQPRYYAVSEPTPVVTGGTEEHPLDPVKFNLVCRMVNSAVHVDFDESIAAAFNTYKVSIYTDEDRRFEYNAHNTTEEYNPVAYFAPKKLYYTFTGTAKENTYPYTLSGTIELEAATNHYMNFRIDKNPSTMNLDIKVDTSFEPVYENVFIEPDFSQNQ